MPDQRQVPVDEAAAVLAHELRGPLAVVNGYLGLLGRAHDEQTREFALGAAQRAVARMDALIDDVLACARGERPAESARMPVDPAAIVRMLLADMPDYHSRVSFVNSCTTYARADAIRLARALSNVLDNALKFSPPDSPVRVTLVNEGNRVRISVEDEGPGIPPAETDRLLRRFERLDRDSDVPGDGIGLGVTAELIADMGGELVVGNREDGHGARVELLLPAAPRDEATG